MAALDDLLARIDDDALRSALERELAPLRGDRELGLVFERHLPEKVHLPGLAVRRGSTVEVRDDPESLTWTVVKVAGDEASLRRSGGDGTQVVETAPVDDLVVVREFGEPIYPGLKSLGRVERGGDKPFHTVIKSENYHALETLLYTCEGQVDAVYLDPPYNSGAKDWKYNNDYVDGNDGYRHSKWLSFMEKRLLLAKRLLNPEDSVLIVTIDEKEYLRLGLLLQQVFPNRSIQMVSIAINPAAVARAGMFGRSDEYAFFVQIGEAAPSRVRLSREWVSERGRTHTGNVRWDLLRRSGDGAARSDSPGCFYPIYVDPDSLQVVEVGEALPDGVSTAPAVKEAVPVLPIRKDGSEGRWQWAPGTFRTRLAQGRVRISGSAEKGLVVSILKDGEFAKTERGEFGPVSRDSNGTIVVDDIDVSEVLAVPGSQWRISSHDSTQYGTRLLGDFLPGRKFPFPKSLYAVEDAINFFVVDKPNALVVDFFGGSGTTAHAVMRLNHRDGGSRRSIVVTNNEVSDDEAKKLRRAGHKPGEPGWEALGIFEHITRPRIEAAITGKTHDGKDVKGSYKFTDEFPMSEGFEENVEFFELTYEDADRVRLGAAFEAVAPLLWLMAGASGPRIETIEDGWALPAGGKYGVLFDADSFANFVEAVRGGEEVVTHAFVVTDSDAVFQRVVAELPDSVTPVRMYESYLRTFAINTGAVE